MLSSDEAVTFAKAVSRVFGWIYFFCWSASFYPQLILNIQRQSTHGFTADFAFSNVLGFCSLTASTAALLFSSEVRSEYAARHPRSPEPTARINDLAFAAHAAFITAVTATQFWPKLWGWPKNRVPEDETEGSGGEAVKQPIGGKKGSLLCRLICGSGIVAIGLLSIVVAVRKKQRPGVHMDELAWIDVIYALQYLKLILTIYKYVPQATSNFLRKSTSGWSINTILFDTTGGVLSLAQLVIDCALQDDWSGFTGNPVKLGLSIISLFFDTVFMIQHYILYGYGDDQKDLKTDTSNERTPLIRGERAEDNV